MPGLPTVIFFNKYDKFFNQPRNDREGILEAIKLKMKPFVTNIETDIISGLFRSNQWRSKSSKVIE